MCSVQDESFTSIIIFIHQNICNFLYVLQVYSGKIDLQMKRVRGIIPLCSCRMDSVSTLDSISIWRWRLKEVGGRKMRKKQFVLLLVFALVFALTLSACGGSGGDTGGDTTPPSSGGSEGNASGELVETGWQSDLDKDVITIRAVRPITGDSALFEETAFGPQYKMWVDEINKDGGLYVKSLDRKVPIDIQVVDDGSDIEKTTQLFENIVANEKPDLVLAPESTARLFAVAPIAQKYDYLLLAAEGGAKELTDQFEDIREDYGKVNTFSVLSYSETQVPALIKTIEELGIESVYCAYINDLHGIEYWGATEAALNEVGIEIAGSEPVHPTDFVPDSIVNNAKASGADAFLGYVYPPQSIPITMTAADLGYNPNFYLLGPGGCYDYFGLFTFGDYTNVALDGVVGWGAWNEKSSERAREYSEHFRSYWIDEGSFWLNADGSHNPDGTVYQDWWGHICYYSVMQVLQQAVENAGEIDPETGSLNQAKLVEYVSTATFDTVLNENLKFTDNILLDDMYLGNIGQWQNGIFEVIDADDRRTADPIYPKPAWQ